MSIQKICIFFCFFICITMFIEAEEQEVLFIYTPKTFENSLSQQDLASFFEIIQENLPFALSFCSSVDMVMEYQFFLFCDLEISSSVSAKFVMLSKNNGRLAKIAEASVVKENESWLKNTAISLSIALIEQIASGKLNADVVKVKPFLNSSFAINVVLKVEEASSRYQQCILVPHGVKKIDKRAYYPMLFSILQDGGINITFIAQQNDSNYFFNIVSKTKLVRGMHKIYFSFEDKDKIFLEIDGKEENFISSSARTTVKFQHPEYFSIGKSPYSNFLDFKGHIYMMKISRSPKMLPLPSSKMKDLEKNIKKLELRFNNGNNNNTEDKDKFRFNREVKGYDGGYGD